MSNSTKSSSNILFLIAAMAAVQSYICLAKPEIMLQLPGAYPGEVTISGWISLGVAVVLLTVGIIIRRKHD